MSTVRFEEVEKLERFYLSSCTELPIHLAKSRHQSFPALTDIISNRQSMERVYQTRSPSGRLITNRISGSGPNDTEDGSDRAKLFFKVCDSLSTGVTTEFIPQNGAETETYNLIMNPSMSKQEFINKLEEGMFRYTSLIKSYGTLTENANELFDGDENYTKSDSVLVKSTVGADNARRDSQNNSKSTTAIADNGTTGRSREANFDTTRAHSGSTTSKIILTGIIFFVFLGFLKNASNR